MFSSKYFEIRVIAKEKQHHSFIPLKILKEVLELEQESVRKIDITYFVARNDDIASLLLNQTEAKLGED